MIVIRRRDPEHRQSRFHLLGLQHALFGADVVHEWGRIGGRGTVRVLSFETEAEARAWATAYERRKRRKGYR